MMGAGPGRVDGGHPVFLSEKNYVRGLLEAIRERMSAAMWRNDLSPAGPKKNEGGSCIAALNGLKNLDFLLGHFTECRARIRTRA